MKLFGIKNKNVQSTKELSREVGVAGEVIFSSYEHEELRSDKVTIKQYREMVDRDPTVEALFNVFTLPIIAATYRIDASKDDASEEQANFVRTNLFEPPYKGGMESPFTLFQDELMLSIVDGFQLWEKVYKIENGKYVLKKLAHRDSIGITLIRDEAGGYGGARQVVGYGERTVDVILPAYKTFLFTHNKSRDYLYGRSALRSLRRPYEKKHKLEYLDSIALQADAIKPKVLIRKGDNALASDEGVKGGALVSKVLRTLSKLGERNSVASIPYGYDVKEITQNGRDPHQSIERQNSEMARAFLATFMLMSSQGKSNTGSYALSDNLKDAMMMSLKAFMTKIEEHINQFIIADLIDLNFATPHYPEFRYDDITSDVVETMWEAFMKLVEKDHISDDMIKSIEEQAANRLDIDLEQVRKEREKREAKEAKKEEAAADNEENSEADVKKPEQNADIDEADVKKLKDSKELSEISARDFPGLHDNLGVDEDKLGCIMLDLQPFDVVRHVENGAADLVQAKPGGYTMGAVAEVQPHVSLLFGLLQNGNAIKTEVDTVLSGWRCDRVALDDIDSFPVESGAEAVPIIARVYDGRLIEAHERLGLLPHVNTFGTYAPHVTLAYVKNDPETVQKWVRSLREAIGGMRVPSVGINYGDKESGDDKEDSGSNAGKFLSDTEMKWWRPLTPAEQNVKFEDINAKMDSLEDNFVTAAEPIMTDFLKQLVAGDMATKSAKDIVVELPTEYAKLVNSTIRNAYNYAKNGAADEHNVPAPATSREAMATIREMTDFVITKQQDDIRSIIAEQRLKQPTHLADEITTVTDIFLEALELALLAWAASILKPTASAIVGRGINNGRNDVFTSIEKNGDLYEYSAILDGKTCSTCRALDGSIVTLKERKTTKWQPPLHFNCRCIWVMICKISDDYKLPEVTGMKNEELADKVEHLKTTRKQELIDTGFLPGGITKVEMESLLMYQGTYYREINDHFRFGKAITPGALKASQRVDNVIARSATNGRIPVYRGIGLNDELKVGQILEESAYMSTSSSRTIATEFAAVSSKTHRYVLEFEIPNGYHSVYMDKVLGERSQYDEAEYLLGRGRRVIIKSMEQDGDITKVKAALIDETGRELADKQKPVFITTPEEAAAAAAKAEANFDINSPRTRRIFKRWEEDNESFAKANGLE